MIRLLLPLTLALCLGCNHSRGKVPVTGQVMIDGKPLPGATVTFHSTDGGALAASARTDSKGRFRLATLGSDGAAPGSYRVLVAKGAATDHEHMLPEDYGHHAAATSFDESEEIDVPQGKSLLPSRYASFASSPLSRQVVKGRQNQFLILLTDPHSTEEDELFGGKP